MFGRLRTFVSALSSGDAGERLARRFLGAKPGWSFVAANWRNPRDRREELDLVMRDGWILVFVEVKTRSSEEWTRPAAAVDARVREVIGNAGSFFKNPTVTPEQCADIIARDPKVVLVDEPFADRRASVFARHIGREAGLVDEDEPRGIEGRLFRAQGDAGFGHVRPILFAGVQRFF